MKLFFRFLFSLLFVFTAWASYVHAQAKCPVPYVANTDVVVTYNSYVRDKTTDITVHICKNTITTLRLINATVLSDVYTPRIIRVSQDIDFFSANITKEKNVFYIEAFEKDIKIPAANIKQPSPTLNDRIEIYRVEDPNAEYNPVKPADPAAPVKAGGASGGGVAVAAATPVPSPSPAATPAKVDLKAPFEVSNQATYDLQISLPEFPKCDTPDTPCDYKYVINVQNGGQGSSKEVAIKKDEKSKKEKPLSPQTETVSLAEGTNTITVKVKRDKKIVDDISSDPITVRCDHCTNFSSSVNTRAVIGLEQIGASSSDNKQSPFLDFFFNAPFTVPYGSRKRAPADSSQVDCEKTPALCRPKETAPAGTAPCTATNHRLCEPIPINLIKNTICNIDIELCKRKTIGFSIWGNVRFSNIPVQNIANLSSFGGFAPDVIGNNDLKSNGFAQSFDFLIGLEKKIFQESALSQGFLPGRSSISLIASAGAVNPISPKTTDLIFKIPKTGTPPLTVKEFLELFPEAADPKTDIAFVAAERDKFFRQYFAGIRIRTNFFDDINRPKNLFPAIVDLTFGQNEAITSSLRGVIGRLDGSAPLPIRGNNFLYIFGAVQLKLGKTISKSSTSFFLEPSAGGTTLSSPTTAIVPIDRYPRTISNRDIFRIGLGIDLFRIFK